MMFKSGNENRRQITLHSFRQFVKSTISDLGYSDFSEYFIGHSGSIYWRKKNFGKAEIFRKVEPYLTFLNIYQLERQGADIQSKVQELEDLIASLRDRDKVKDDAIAHLSDQLLAISHNKEEELIIFDDNYYLDRDDFPPRFAYYRHMISKIHLPHEYASTSDEHNYGMKRMLRLSPEQRYQDEKENW